MAEDFMNSSLCIWLTRTFDDLGPPSNIYHLADGEFLNKIMASIAPGRYTMLRVHKEVGDEAKARIDNLNFLLKNLIFFYEEVMSSMIVARLPDIRLLGQQPQAYASSAVLEAIFTLILGVAFQCENKTMYIEEVQQLPEDVQKQLMTTIQDLTETNKIVASTYIDTESMGKSEVAELCSELLASLQNVVLERNELHDKCIRATQERDEYLDAQAARSGRRSVASISDSFNDSRSEGSRPNTPAYSSEISDLRTKLLKYEEEIESKTDTINRLRDENKSSTEHIVRLKNENRTLYEDAQSARIYRDEIDALRSKAEKLDKYEADIAKYRDKLEDMEYLKNRVKELKNHNDQLVEMNELLKEELVSSEQINKAIIAEEEKNIKLRGMIEEVGAQKEYGERVIHDLTNKKKQIELELRHSANMVQHMQKEIDELTISHNEIRMALLERDGESESVKFGITADKELSQDDQGQTPIINRRMSAVKDGSKEDPNMEVLNSKVKRLEIDNLHLRTQTESLKNSNAKLQQLEQSTEKDKLVIDTNKAEIARLLDEINLEKTRVESVQQKVVEAHSILKEIGYDTEKLNEVNVISDREKFLKYEERLKQSLNHSLKMKEERIVVLEDRVKENTSQNDSLRQELSIIKRQNKSVHKANKSLQESLDSSVSSIQNASQTRRISKGVQYEHHVSMSSTPIKQRLPSVAMPSPKLDISSIKENNVDVQLNDSPILPILNVSYESVSLSESTAALQLLRQDCVDLKEENDQLFLDKERLEQEVQELQVERRSHLVEIQNLREQNLEMKSKFEERCREYKKQVTRLEEFEIECQALEEFNDKLKRACDELETEKNFVNSQCNKLLLQNQELLIKTIEDQEKSREETRVFQDQIASMKQDNQQLAMNLALKSQNPADSSLKKKPFYKTIFKSKKTKGRDECGSVSATPNIDEYLDQLSLDSAERLTPPDYDRSGFYTRDHFVEPELDRDTFHGFNSSTFGVRDDVTSATSRDDVTSTTSPDDVTSQHSDEASLANTWSIISDSDNSSRTMSGDGRLEMQGSLNSLARGQDPPHITGGEGGRIIMYDSSAGFRNPGLTRTMSTDNERKTQSDDLTPRRHGSMRLKNKSESLDLTPRVEPRTMTRPIPPGTHGTPDSRQLSGVHTPEVVAALRLPLSSRSAQSLSSLSTGNRAVEQVVSEPPSAFRQFNNAPALPPRSTRHAPEPRHPMHATEPSRHYSSDSDFRQRSGGSSVVSDNYTSSQRGLHDEDPQNSSFYEYGCV